MTDWWMQIGEVKSDGNVDIRYNIPNSGTFTDTVPEQFARLLKRAIEVGKCLRSKEIKALID